MIKSKTIRFFLTSASSAKHRIVPAISYLMGKKNENAR